MNQNNIRNLTVDGVELAKYDLTVNKLNAADAGKELTIFQHGLIAKLNNDDEKDFDYNTVRSILPIPPFNSGENANESKILFYFEVEIIHREFGPEGTDIGFCTKQFPLEGKCLGKDENSIGIAYNYNGLHDSVAFGEEEVIGLGIIHSPGNSIKCFSTRNGELMKKKKLPTKFAKLELYPAVTLSEAGEIIRINFGKEEWRFKEFKRAIEA